MTAHEERVQSRVEPREIWFQTRREQRGASVPQAETFNYTLRACNHCNRIFCANCGLFVWLLWAPIEIGKWTAFGFTDYFFFFFRIYFSKGEHSKFSIYDSYNFRLWVLSVQDLRQDFLFSVCSKINWNSFIIFLTFLLVFSNWNKYYQALL